MIAAWRGWLLAMLCATAFAVPASAQTIPARGGLHEDFGRLVIDFPGATSAEISGEGRHLELRFDRAAKIDIADAASTLKDYIAKATLSPDNRRLALDFNAPVTWQAFNDGAKLALDFAFADDASQRQFDHGPNPAGSKIKTVGAGAPTPAATTTKTAATAQAQAAPAAVGLRSGEHPGFSRLAFDWPKTVNYEIRQSGDQAEIKFSSPGAIDLEKVVGDLPPRIDALSTVPTANGVTVKLGLKPGTVLRDFRSDHTVVLDVYDQNAANIPPPSKPVAQQAEAPALQNELQEIPAEPELPQAVASAEPAPAVPPLQSNAPEPANPALSKPAAPPEPQLQSAMPEAAVEPTTAGGGASGPGVAVPATATPPATFEPPRVAPPAVKVNVTTQSLKDGATLYFDWPKPVALAVFRRGDALWLVFDTPGKADLKLLKPLQPIIGKIEPVKSSFGLAFRLTGGTAASPTTESEGQGVRWKVTLHPGQSVVPANTVDQLRETLPNGGSSVYIKAIASGAEVDLEDPIDRAKLMVTPGQVAGYGIPRESDWPDFKLLPSYQGVVMQLLNDRPKVESSPNGVVISLPPPAVAAAEAPAPEAEAAAPPAASAATSEATAEAPKPKAEASPAEAAPASEAEAPPSKATPLTITGGLFDMKKWRRGGEATFQEDNKTLGDRVKNASSGDRNRARLDFAEFLLANGYFPEAGRQISDILQDDRNAAGNPLIMAIGAAARTMQGDYGQANKLLAAPALQGVPEADLMAAYIAFKGADLETAAKLFSGPLPDISEYPKAFRTDLRIAAAKALLEKGDPLTAQNYIDPLTKDDPDPEAKAWAAYLDGERQQKIGQKAGALATWEKLVDSPIDEIKARAQFAVISEQLDEKSIDPKDAVAKLEALRYLWRGDTFEFDLLTRLGHLYFDVAQPRKGLITMRQAATHYPDHPKAKQAADDMTAEFRRLYLGGGADRLSPLTAVALYDEFRELTPPGPDGDRMIAALADRLVKVDLLDRAGDLLERQVKARLSGDAKVAAGTRLAAVRLLDDKPDGALKALGETEDPAATKPELQAQRQRLRARALFDTGDTLKGLGLVENDGSLEGLWLKSDMYWKLREWPSAADALGQLISAEQAKRLAAQKGPPPDDIAKNPASVLDKALADAKAAATADGTPLPDDANAAAAGDATAQPVQKPLLDPLLSGLVLNRAVALSLANDRRGLKEIGRSFGKQMDTTPLAQPFKVLTATDSGLSDSYAAQKKSVDQFGAFVEEYRKILQSEALSGSTEPAPDTGPLAPLDKPADTSGASEPAPAPKTNDQTAGQPAPQPTVQ